MRLPVAREGLPFFLPPLVAAAALSLLGGPTWLAAGLALLGVLLALFFRDPERRPGGGDGSLVSPADGRVIRLERRPDGSTELSIFLSLFDVHINRSPVSGKLREARHRPGRFRLAWDARAARENERIELEIDSELGPIAMTEITGFVARRIVLWKRPGDSLARGERLGLMKFGSRVDLLLPAEVAPRVALGDRVRGAETVVAERSGACS